ncbi:MAG: hypothetical protein RLY87_1424 [Chloroflexota bacterium]|jgi:putative protease
MNKTYRPEVMSPAGYWPQLNAAVEAGADAVYFGLTHFSARAKVGFTLDELHEVMQTLHRRNVRGFVTFNTLIYGHELSEASRAIAAIAEAGVDAIIVQDIGVATLARQIAPHLEVHGSTQMSVTNVAGVEFARRLGANRVVLARELSLAEIRAIKEATDVELEIFVHGALCVSYSGQCFSSEAWGGRSANRGQCAQACRLPYDLMVDGHQKPLGDARYLLSPGDLMAIDHVDEIVDIGISSLKIEGRYKDAEYVALTTRAYRAAVDAALAKRQEKISRDEKLLLEQVYSRGLGDFFIGGTNHQQVVNGRAPRHRGICVGTVVQVGEQHIVVEPRTVPLKAGDGIVFDAADWRSPEEREEGSRIFSVTNMANGNVSLSFGRRAINHTRVRPGDLVWRTNDVEVAKAAKPYIEPHLPVTRQPIEIFIDATADGRLQMTWQLAYRPDAEVVIVLDPPTTEEPQRPVTDAFLEKQLGRLGGTYYRLASVTNRSGVELSLAPSYLNTIRREAVAQLDAVLAAVDVGTVHEPTAVLATAQQRVVHQPDTTAAVQLHVMVRQPWQLDSAIAAKPASITLDYLELYGLKDAVAQVKAAGIVVQVASPRVLKPGEARITQFLAKLDCPVLVRGAGYIDELRDAGVTMIGDFSLNAANALSAQVLRDAGITRLAPTHDCNAAQITDMVALLGGTSIEVIAYHHLPVFHTEHCVFCRFLSSGTSYKDCGRPCESHQVGLRDRHGRIHPVIADVGCRNTVFGAEAQEGSKHMTQWLLAGVKHIRLEFVQESAEDVSAVIALYQAGIAGTQSWTDIGRELRHAAPSGVTEGSFFVPDNYMVIPLR